jgi:predicted metal-dependent hydrolase
MLKKTYSQGFVLIWGPICFSILANIGHNVFVLAHFCTTRTTKRRKKKRKFEVYKGLLFSPILGVMFFFWPKFAPQQQKEKEKRCDVYKRALITLGAT